MTISVCQTWDTESHENTVEDWSDTHWLGLKIMHTATSCHKHNVKRSGGADRLVSRHLTNDQHRSSIWSHNVPSDPQQWIILTTRHFSWLWLRSRWNHWLIFWCRPAVSFGDPLTDTIKTQVLFYIDNLRWRRLADLISVSKYTAAQMLASSPPNRSFIIGIKHATRSWTRFFLQASSQT